MPASAVDSQQSERLASAATIPLSPVRIVEEEAANRAGYTLGNTQVIAWLLRVSTEEPPAWATEPIHVVDHDPTWVD